MCQINTALSANDDKVYICDDNIRTDDFGFKGNKFNKNIIYIIYMTYLKLLEHLFDDKKD